MKKISEHVRAKTKIPVQDQVLLLGSKILKPQRKLLSYGIDKQTTMHLTLKVVKPRDEELPSVLVELCNEGQRVQLRGPGETDDRDQDRYHAWESGCDLQWQEAGRWEDHGGLWHQRGQFTLPDSPLRWGLSSPGMGEIRSKSAYCWLLLHPHPLMISQINEKDK